MTCKLRGFLRICKSCILAIWALLRIIVQIYTFLLISQNRHFFYFLKQRFFNNKSPVYECFDKPLRRVREAALTATRVIDCEPFINAARDLPVSADLSATLKQKNALESASAINAAKKAICQD